MLFRRFLVILADLPCDQPGQDCSWRPPKDLDSTSPSTTSVDQSEARDSDTGFRNQPIQTSRSRGKNKAIPRFRPLEYSRIRLLLCRARRL